MFPSINESPFGIFTYKGILPASLAFFGIEASAFRTNRSTTNYIEGNLEMLP